MGPATGGVNDDALIVGLRFDRLPYRAAQLIAAPRRGRRHMDRVDEEGDDRDAAVGVQEPHDVAMRMGDEAVLEAVRRGEVDPGIDAAMEDRSGEDSVTLVSVATSVAPARDELVADENPAIWLQLGEGRTQAEQALAEVFIAALVLFERLGSRLRPVRRLDAVAA